MQIFCYNVDLGKSFPGLKFNVREGKIAHSYQSDAGIYTRQMTGRYVNALASLIKRLITNKKERIDDYALFLYYKRNLFQ